MSCYHFGPLHVRNLIWQLWSRCQTRKHAKNAMGTSPVSGNVYKFMVSYGMVNLEYTVQLLDLWYFYLGEHTHDIHWKKWIFASASMCLLDNEGGSDREEKCHGWLPSRIAMMQICLGTVLGIKGLLFLYKEINKET